MPAALVAYWTAWNEPDLDLIRQHLDAGVEHDVVWNDPRDSFSGIDELEAAVRRLRSSKPRYRFVIASEVDHHHDRHRYRWDMTSGTRVMMEGLDIVTLSPRSGRIERVDGFFGHPTPTKQAQSGIPEPLRPVGDCGAL
ncbi:MAG: nuclear transport factor 2 family protein [Acidimicrobiales bacterium]